MIEWDWSIRALRRARADGFDPAKVTAALNSGRPLWDDVEVDVKSAIVDIDGELIEVWFEEDDEDGRWDLIRVFEAGFLGRAAWGNAQQQRREGDR